MPLDSDLDDLVHREPLPTVDVPWQNPHALPRRGVVWEGSLEDDRPCILHKIVTIGDDVWGIVEEANGALSKIKISRLRLTPIGGGEHVSSGCSPFKAKST